MTGSDSNRTSIRKVAIARFIGTTIEWQDFFLDGTASALVFGKLLLPMIATDLLRRTNSSTPIA